VYLSILILFAAASVIPPVALSILDGRDARRRRAKDLPWTAATSATS
jgi:hypothetical protein